MFEGSPPSQTSLSLPPPSSGEDGDGDEIISTEHPSLISSRKGKSLTPIHI